MLFSVAVIAAFANLALANPIKPPHAQPPHPPHPPHPHHERADGLNSAIVAQGRSYVGVAVTIRDDTAERAIIDNTADFGSITPENAMKWEATEPARGQFTLAGADAVVAAADANGQQLRCHTLVWHSQLPAWVSGGGFDNATLIEVMRSHIEGVAGKYKGKCTHWDVVNEALNEDGTYRDSVFLRTIGEAYIPIAFRIAAEVDPTAKLYYNDYNLEYGSEKAAGALRIVKLIQSYGIKIDGVGLQAHLTSEPTGTSDAITPSEEALTRVLTSYTDLGVDVAYTELDVRMNTPATPEKLAVQAEAYARVVKSCLNVERCVGITIWGASDKYSWIPGVFNGEGAALLWGDQYEKKPAYQASLDAISA